MIFRPNDIYSITNLKILRFSGAIKVLRDAVGCQNSLKIVLRKCTVQRYYRYEGVGGCRISRKNVT